MQRVNVLGTEYELREATEENDKGLVNHDGYCDSSTKICVVDKMEHEDDPNSKKNLPEYKKSVVRHELMHAFLYESGLDGCSWANNEELVDWIAIQFPKILKAYQEVDAL